MSKKNKKKKGMAESTNKKKLILRLQKHQAFSDDTAKTLKELGLAEGNKFERHIEVLISEGTLKKETKAEVTRYWIIKDKISKKKKSGTGNFLVIWLLSSFVVLLIFVVVFK